ncbi:MAG: glycosyltransferase family 2 protein [Oliverpabstia sp.]|nr:glycosyltransferase family 2 protein [Oliverpabstia sp.]
MKKVSVIIPNYNGMQYVKRCLDSLMAQTLKDWEILFIDNGSADGSRELVEKEYPLVRVIALPENLGFCGAVNIGIHAATAPYVVLLNNDTEAEPEFLQELYDGIRRKPRAFSGGAMMLQFHDREKIDDAGNFYNALGWAFALGKGKPAADYNKERKIFSACGGAAIYRKDLLEELGYFDEEHFAYLEDTDIGYRAQIAGYENWYFPKAKVYHVGSGTSGSRYNQFKIRYSSRNNIYMIYKNMPILQIVLNMPLLVAGFTVKLLFFSFKGYGREYAAGIKNGFSICKKNKVRFQWKHMGNYCRIQIQLWVNLIRRFE